MTLDELFATKGVDLEKATARLKQVAKELGLPLGERERTYNSRMAQELAKWAESKGKGDPYHDAVFRAYFVDGLDIGNTDVLVGLGKSVGLPEDEGRSVLQLRDFKDAVDSDYLQCRQLGITAVPTFRAGQNMVVGAQPYDVLERLLKASGARERKGEDG